MTYTETNNIKSSTSYFSKRGTTHRGIVASNQKDTIVVQYDFVSHFVLIQKVATNGFKPPIKTLRH